MKRGWSLMILLWELESYGSHIVQLRKSITKGNGIVAGLGVLERKKEAAG